MAARDPSDGEVCIWGAGLIGFTLAADLVVAGHRCLLVDVDADRVARVNAGLVPFDHVRALADRYPPGSWSTDRLRATLDVAAATGGDHWLHVVCVPTEAGGRIDPGPLRDVVAALGARPPGQPPMCVVIESTVAPRWIDDVVHRGLREAGLSHGVDYHVGASPRRDWLTTPDRTLASVPKIVGGDSPEAVATLTALYGSVCERVLVAPDAKHAALVKVLENYFRYRSILLAAELDAMFPQYDLSTGMRLAATKWNMDLYHPSLGIGGYCVPLAKDYLAAEARDPSWCDDLDRVERDLYATARRHALAHGRFARVAVLGVAYAPGIKVATRSPSLAFVAELLRRGRDVLVHDPLYGDDEVADLTSATPLSFPDGLATCDTVVVMTDHAEYRDVPHDVLLDRLAPGCSIVDNLGAWADRRFPADIHYVEVGGAGFFVGEGG